MKIYTKTGDAGTTGLANGARIEKNSARITAIGEVDELNSLVGMVRVHASEAMQPTLEKIQNELFVLGAELADPTDTLKEKTPRLTEDDVAFLERTIDELSAELAPLTQFILPGGSAVAGAFHQCRSVARRAERAVVALAPEEKILLRYLNRMSDLFFTAARWENKRAGVPDVFWKK